MSKINKAYFIKVRLLMGILFCLKGLYPMQAQTKGKVISENPDSLSVESSDFSQDTILINKYNQLARKYLYQDAMRSISYAQKSLESLPET